MNFTRIKKQFLYLSLMAILFLPSFATATRFILEPSSVVIGVDREFVVRVMVDTEGESDNAFSGDIVFPENIELVSTSLEESVISTWVKAPVASGNSVNFLGITPGGFSGVIDPFTARVLPGVIFSMKFRSTHEGDGKIEFVEGKALRNDGLATTENLSFGNSTVSVAKNAAELPNLPIQKDEFPPEKFIMKITTHPSVFDGKYFLAFDTIDKGSKVESFYVREGRSAWVLTESPYLLDDQTLRSRIWVKATDSYGNERIEYLRATVRNKIPSFLMVLLGLGVLVLVGKLLKNKK